MKNFAVQKQKWMVSSTPCKTPLQDPVHHLVLTGRKGQEQGIQIYDALTLLLMTACAWFQYHHPMKEEMSSLLFLNQRYKLEVVRTVVLHFQGLITEEHLDGFHLVDGSTLFLRGMTASSPSTLQLDAEQHSMNTTKTMTREERVLHSREVKIMLEDHSTTKSAA